MNPASVRKLAARHNLVEIAEARRTEEDGFTKEPAAVDDLFTIDVPAGIRS